MISIVSLGDVEQVLRPTVYLPPGAPLRVVSLLDPAVVHSSPATAATDRVVAIPIVRENDLER